MEQTSSLYSIYKRTLIITAIVSVILVALTYVYVSRMQPVKVKNPNAVQELKTGEMEAMASTVDPVDVVVNQNEIGLFLNGAGNDSEYLWVPVADGIKSSDIMIENHYMDRQLWVLVNGGDATYYKDAYISGNLTGVVNGIAEQGEGQVILKFSLEKVYEFNTIFEDGVLYVEKVSPRELYDQIVVIDPDGYVPEELVVADSLTPARICLDIGSKLQQLLESEGVRVYMTSLDERELSDEDCLSLSADVKPDMLIRIETAYDEDSKVYGTQTVYNGTYFIPGFGSIELADMIETSVTTAIGGRAAGLVEAEEEDIVVNKATVPAASVKVGYYTNTQENILLNRDDYRSKIAQGLHDAVMTVYDK